MGTIRNLSEGGVCLEITRPLRPTTRLRVIFPNESGGLELTAQVIWTGEPRAPGEATPLAWPLPA